MQTVHIGPVCPRIQLCVALNPPRQLEVEGHTEITVEFSPTRHRPRGLPAREVLKQRGRAKDLQWVVGGRVGAPAESARRHATRCIVNEAELAGSLASAAAVDLRTLPLMQQLLTVATARGLVGVHGQALATLAVGICLDETLQSEVRLGA